jgi:hypothetical protein
MDPTEAARRQTIYEARRRDHTDAWRECEHGTSTDTVDRRTAGEAANGMVQPEPVIARGG